MRGWNRCDEAQAQEDAASTGIHRQAVEGSGVGGAIGGKDRRMQRELNAKHRELLNHR